MKLNPIANRITVRNVIKISRFRTVIPNNIHIFVYVAIANSS